MIADYGGLDEGDAAVSPIVFVIVTLSSIGLARHERLRRRVPDPAGRLRQTHRHAGRIVAATRRHSGRRVHAVDVPADVLGPQGEIVDSVKKTGMLAATSTGASFTIMVPILI